VAAITTAVVAVGGAAMSFEGQRQAGKANKRAGELNAWEAGKQAQFARQQAQEDEKQFRLSFRRDQSSNVAAIGASGIKQEGSPLEVLRDNTASAETDAINIRRGGERSRSSFLRQASAFREGARASGRASAFSSAGSLLSGASNIVSTGRQAGAF